MLPLEYAHRWRMASLVLLLAVLIATVTPAVWSWPDRMRLIEWVGNIDKWTHAITFAGLTIWFSGQYRPNAYWRIAVGLLAFGLFIELCQRMLSYRTAELWDIAANAAGIIAGLAIAGAGIGGWSQRFESWLQRRWA